MPLTFLFQIPAPYFQAVLRALNGVESNFKGEESSTGRYTTCGMKPVDPTTGGLRQGRLPNQHVSYNLLAEPMQKSMMDEDVTTANYETDTIYWSIFLSVERGLGILGESGKQTILRYLSKEGIPREEIPLRLDYFVKVLGEIFGVGAVLIEGEIVQNLKLMESLSSNISTLAGAAPFAQQRKKPMYH